MLGIAIFSGEFLCFAVMPAALVMSLIFTSPTIASTVEWTSLLNVALLVLCIPLKCNADIAYAFNSHGPTPIETVVKFFLAGTGILWTLAGINLWVRKLLRK